MINATNTSKDTATATPKATAMTKELSILVIVLSAIIKTARKTDVSLAELIVSNLEKIILFGTLRASYHMHRGTIVPTWHGLECRTFLR